MAKAFQVTEAVNAKLGVKANRTRILRSLEQSMPLDVACSSVPVSERQFLAWLDENPPIHKDEVSIAMAKGQEVLIEEIRAAKDWKAKKWLLERLDPAWRSEQRVMWHVRSRLVELEIEEKQAKVDILTGKNKSGSKGPIDTDEPMGLDEPEVTLDADGLDDPFSMEDYAKETSALRAKAAEINAKTPTGRDLKMFYSKHCNVEEDRSGMLSMRLVVYKDDVEKDTQLVKRWNLLQEALDEFMGFYKARKAGTGKHSG